MKEQALKVELIYKIDQKTGTQTYSLIIKEMSKSEFLEKLAEITNILK